jgi:hypothetical protein
MMPLLFPGMDPFVEASGVWPDFHHTFITICREQLLARLPANYDAGVEERVELIDQGDRSSQIFIPDVSVRHTRETDPSARGIAILEDLEPVSVILPKIETESIGYIEIRTIREGSLVSVIEVLSPTNKVDPGRRAYRLKMEQFRQASVNLVEIDLLLDGKRLETVEPLPLADYYALVSRPERYRLTAAYCWSIRRKLPKIPIPLKVPDADIALDLDEAFRTTFDRGGYARRVRYDLPLPGNLTDADREWVKSVIAKPA